MSKILPITARKIWINAIWALLASAIINIILYFISSSVGWITEDILVETPQGQRPIGPEAVLMASTVPLLVAALVFWVLSLVTRHAVLIFRLVALVVFVGYIFLPLNIVGASAGMIFILELMHVVSAIAAVYFLTIRAKK